MQDNTQLNHQDHARSVEKFPLSIIANDINSPLNVGSLFRLCDALGIEKLYLCGDTVKPPNSKIKKTSRSTEEYVDHESHGDAFALASSLKKAGLQIIVLEITNTSIDIGSDEFRSVIAENRPACLVLGSENTGVDESLLKLADITVHIPMQGNNSSMNVVTAAAIACYQITHVMDTTTGDR
jgi:tRNA G18 (ribose-2'-O)-methylase SpoU